METVDDMFECAKVSIMFAVWRGVQLFSEFVLKILFSPADGLRAVIYLYSILINVNVICIWLISRVGTVPLGNEWELCGHHANFVYPHDVGIMRTLHTHVMWSSCELCIPTWCGHHANFVYPHDVVIVRTLHTHMMWSSCELCIPTWCGHRANFTYPHDVGIMRTLHTHMMWASCGLCITTWCSHSARTVSTVVSALFF